MKGYSEIRQVRIPKHTTVDSSDAVAPLRRPCYWSSSCTSETRKSIVSTVGAQSTNNSATIVDSVSQEKEQEDETGEIFGVILRRSCSVSTNPSRGLRFEKQNSALQQGSEMRRIFFIRRSSSMSQGYCRIHHQENFIADQDGKSSTSTGKTKKRTGNILKACSLFFRF